MMHHGINVPVFALRNPEGSGVGEYLDLIPLIQWCKKIGFDVIQLLPLNDSGDDPSPYSALSANALHPLFLSLWALPDLADTMKKWLQKLRGCNSSQRFDYPQVLAAKERFLRAYFEEKSAHIIASKVYEEFCKEHVWLEKYALFKCLKAKNEKKPWWEWSASIPCDTSEIDFHKVIQFFCFQQFEQVRNIAKDSGVMLKGDIPILIGRDSSDVWAHKELFQLEFQAGAPPDMYAPEGQAWGFPIYNWQAHRESHFTWWKERLHTAEKLYDLYRIDHIVGFFRIWAIRLGEMATSGFFIPGNEAEWIPQGSELLEMMLKSTSMRPIGEDLGSIPPAVREKMQELNIPGTKVMRWERYWNGDRSFIPVKDYPACSMTTVSTHDSETLGEWWWAGHEDVQLYCKEMGWSFEPELSYDKRASILQASHRSRSIYHINLLQEYLNLFPHLSWENPDDERINIPGIVNSQNWTYRFRPTLQEMTQDQNLAIQMQSFTIK